MGTFLLVWYWPPFLLTGGSGHSNAAVFSLGQSVGFEVRLWFAVCGLGVVTPVAGPLELLSGVLSQIIIKAAPFDLPSLPFEIRALPLCILKEKVCPCLYARGLKAGNCSEVG